jgi:hypothetical protein
MLQSTNETPKNDFFIGENPLMRKKHFESSTLAPKQEAPNQIRTGLEPDSYKYVN